MYLLNSLLYLSLYFNFEYVFTNVLSYISNFCISDNHLEIRISTRLLLDCLLSSGYISDAEVTLFYNGVRVFYEITFGYALTHLPINDPLLKNAQFINFNARNNDNIGMKQLEYFINRCELC